MHCARTGPGLPGLCEVVQGDLLWEWPQRLAVLLDQPAQHRPRPGDGDLLAHDSSDGDLGAVHVTGHSQAGAAAQQWTQHRVAAENGGHRHRIAVGVDQAARSFYGGGDVAQVAQFEFDRDGGRAHVRQVGEVDPEDARRVGQPQRAGVPAVPDRLYPGQRSRTQEAQQAAAVEGRADCQSQPDGPRCARPASGTVAQLGGGRPVHRADRVVELPHRVEAGGEGDLCEAEGGRVDEGSRGLGAPGAGQGERSGAEFGGEHPGQMARGVAEPRCEAGHAFAVDDSVRDQSHGATGGGGLDVPLRAARGRVRDASLAGPVARRLCGRGSRVEADVAWRRGARRATRAAVDAGGRHRCVEDAVEPPIPRGHRLVAGRVVRDRRHASILPRGRGRT